VVVNWTEPVTAFLFAAVLLEAAPVVEPFAGGMRFCCWCRATGLCVLCVSLRLSSPKGLDCGSAAPFSPNNPGVGLIVLGAGLVFLPAVFASAPAGVAILGAVTATAGAAEATAGAAEATVGAVKATAGAVEVTAGADEATAGADEATAGADEATGRCRRDGSPCSSHGSRCRRRGSTLKCDGSTQARGVSSRECAGFWRFIGGKRQSRGRFVGQRLSRGLRADEGPRSP
jgi:hypothetical protein